MYFIVTYCNIFTVPNLQNFHQLSQGLGHIPTMPHGLPPALPASLTAHQGLPQLPNMNHAAMMGMGLSPAVANQMAANLAAARMPQGMAQAGCVILVSNLDEEVSNTYCTLITSQS